MLKSKELRAKAWESLKGKYWLAFVVVLVTGIITSFGNSFISFAQQLLDVLNLVDPAELDNEMLIGALVVNGIAAGSTIIGAILSIFVSSAITVGVCNYFIKNTYSKPTFADAFSGFKVKYGRNIGTLLLVAIKSVLWTCLFIIPGIIKMFEYSMPAKKHSNFQSR